MELGTLGRLADIQIYVNSFLPKNTVMVSEDIYEKLKELPKYQDKPSSIL